MPFLIMLTVVAVTVAVVALQNAHAITVSFLFWQFEAPLALVILGATFAGLVIGGSDRIYPRRAPLEPPPGGAEGGVRREQPRRSAALEG